MRTHPLVIHCPLGEVCIKGTGDKGPQCHFHFETKPLTVNATLAYLHSEGWVEYFNETVQSVPECAWVGGKWMPVKWHMLTNGQWSEIHRFLGSIDFEEDV